MKPLSPLTLLLLPLFAFSNDIDVLSNTKQEIINLKQKQIEQKEQSNKYNWLSDINLNASISNDEDNTSTKDYYLSISQDIFNFGGISSQIDYAKQLKETVDNLISSPSVNSLSTIEVGDSLYSEIIKSDIQMYTVKLSTPASASLDNGYSVQVSQGMSGKLYELKNRYNAFCDYVKAQPSKIDVLEKYAFGATITKRLELYKKYLSVNDSKYLSWAIKEMVCWQQVAFRSDIIHIHGDKDSVFPIENIKNAIVIKNGTHIAIINKYKWFNENLPRLILGS